MEKEHAIGIAGFNGYYSVFKLTKPYYLPIFPIAQDKNPQRSPLRLRLCHAHSKNIPCGRKDIMKVIGNRKRKKIRRELFERIAGNLLW